MTSRLVPIPGLKPRSRPTSHGQLERAVRFPPTARTPDGETELSEAQPARQRDARQIADGESASCACCHGNSLCDEDRNALANATGSPAQTRSPAGDQHRSEGLKGTPTSRRAMVRNRTSRCVTRKRNAERPRSSDQSQAAGCGSVDGHATAAASSTAVRLDRTEGRQGSASRALVEEDRKLTRAEKVPSGTPVSRLDSEPGAQARSHVASASSDDRGSARV